MRRAARSISMEAGRYPSLAMPERMPGPPAEPSGPPDPPPEPLGPNPEPSRRPGAAV
jgi:hypothetical protein